MRFKEAVVSKRVVSLRAEAQDAAAVLGVQIRTARHERGWTAKRLAAAIYVSERTVLALESGAGGTAIGTVFNAAAVLGVPLFGAEDRAELARMRRRGEDRLALIGQRVRVPELTEEQVAQLSDF